MAASRAAVAAAAAALTLIASAAIAQRIYTCVDASGRKITSDRPIPECADRPQHELNPSGTVRAVITPPPTASERAVIEERERQQVEAAHQATEQRRRERGLLLRFPDEAMHQRARNLALADIDTRIRDGEAAIVGLQKQGKELQLEAEFYAANPARMPSALRAQIRDNTQFIETQRRLIESQRSERERVQQRFDEELAVLRRLWTSAPPPAAPASAPRRAG